MPYGDCTGPDGRGPRRRRFAIYQNYPQDYYPRRGTFTGFFRRLFSPMNYGQRGYGQGMGYGRGRGGKRGRRGGW
ncbi:hypothetical protein [Candidatus Aciduliprofundum boonei]|uniref:hypothetical protein n=1 Tax=Candidatus Aciduliprofundum boonei TaxID=379547 RepID=UPI000180389B|nr:hypothetical protein [Candidatus Aciduliprofundum boonei]EDY34511.1 hypothetical protein ABOONEI_36 [Aciduliprofundum boonei T469]EDY34985.1 hypothetical protein ABOONEI_1271 [Aciduliprofundum boonei T469]HII54961.1 hypothetical protein [Candidatus Aciduliprofundum boonei]